MIEFISTHPLFFLTFTGLLGLAVGSFLNVVIYRLPIILENDWRKQCLEFLGQEPTLKQDIELYNLAHPPSHCPFCNTKIAFYHNIPILSYLMLKGKCAKCKSKIPLSYLIVEVLTLLLTILVAFEFGFSFPCFAVLIFTWILITISFIDINHQLLPDALSIPLLWLGLLISSFNLFANSHDAILGAVIGYLFFWITDKLFLLIRKKEGIGHGDFKLLAASGAWLGWQLLPFVILTSSIVATLVGGSILIFKNKSYDTPIPFGPFIALASFIGIIWGFDITQYYLSLLGINAVLGNV